MKATKADRSLLIASTASIALFIACDFATAAAVPRSWTGAVSTDWLDRFNWSPNTDAPVSTLRSAVFDTAFTTQPSIPGSSSILPLGGLWVKGATVGDIEIGVTPAAVTTRTLQVHSVLNDVDDVAILIDSGTTGKLTINTTSLKVGDAQSWVNNSSNVFTINAGVNVNALSLTIKGSGDTVINGATSGGGTFTKDGAGTLTFATVNHAHSGTTAVSAGTLRVTSELSSSTALVNINGGSLEGTGKIGRPTTIASGATIAPGIGNTTAGTLTMDRNLSLGGIADFDLLSASNYDKVSFNSLGVTSRTLTYGGTLKVDAAGATFAYGQVYDLFNWGANSTRTGTFASIQLPTLPFGLWWETFGSQTFDYSTGQIAVVPEPMSATVVGAVATLGLLRRRRRV